MCPRAFVLFLGESPFTHELIWRTVWEHQVLVIVTLLTPASKVSAEYPSWMVHAATLLTLDSLFKDDLSTLSEPKSFGDLTVSLQSEDILSDYTIRRVKVRKLLCLSS